MKRVALVNKFVVALGLCLTLIAGCQKPRSQPRPSNSAPPVSASNSPSQPTTQPVFDEIYARSSRVFEKAVLWKPDEDNSEANLIPLAPLIVQEIKDSDEESNELELYIDGDCKDSLKEADGNCPTILCLESTILMSGKSFRQLTYFWEYRDKSKQYATAVQSGFRMTLDEKGFPILWEVLGEPGSQKEIYVSQRLETLATAEFGPPIAGRRFSIERSVEEQPHVVVSRVLADGPVPMGPYVYLSAGDHEVTTLACRCMESQVRNFSATRGYRLLGAELVSGKLFEQTIQRRRPKRGGSHKPTPLDEVLRLPSRL